MRIGLSRPRSQKSTPTASPRPHVMSNTFIANMPPSLEDERPQPPLPTRNPPTATASRHTGRHFTEPSLKSALSQPYEVSATARSEPLVVQSDTIEESEDSVLFPMSHGSAKASSLLDASPVFPSRALPVVEHNNAPEIATSSPTKRRSPTCSTGPATPLLPSDSEHLAESTELSELQDSQPLDEASFPTPPDSQHDAAAAGDNNPPLESASAPVQTSYRRVSDLGLRFPTRSTPQTLVSPSRIASRISPTKPKAVLLRSRTVRRSPTPEHQSSTDDDFTRGMSPKKQPQVILSTIFGAGRNLRPSSPPDEDSLDEFSHGAPSAASASNSIPPLEATYIDPPTGRSARSTRQVQTPTPPHQPEHASSASQLDSSEIHTGSDTQRNDDSDKAASPIRTGRFGNLPSSPGFSAPLSGLISEAPGSLRMPSDDDDVASFAATQVLNEPSTGIAVTPEPNRSRLFSTIMSPAAPKPSPRATSTIPKSIPEGRRLQRRRRAQTDVPEQPSPRKMQSREQSPVFEATYIDPPPQAIVPPASDTGFDQPEEPTQLNETSQYEEATQINDPTPPTRLQLRSKPAQWDEPTQENEPTQKNESTQENEPTQENEAAVQNGPVQHNEPIPQDEPTQLNQPTQQDEPTQLNETIEQDEPTQLNAPAQQRMRDNVTPAPPLSGIHEVWGESLALPVRPRVSPRKYGRKGNGRHRSAGDSSDCADEEVAGSDSSSSTAEDPEDFTYRQPQQPETMSSPQPTPPVSSPPLSPQSPARPAKIKLRISAAMAAGPASSSARGNRGKRKVMSPSPDLSGPSSGSAPEDLEDFSYRPVTAGKGKAKAKSAVKSAARTTARTARPAKKARVAPAIRPGSTRATSVATSEALPTPPVSMPDGQINVLARWPKTGDYYAGTITGRNKTGFRIKFYDGMTATVPLDKLRILNLKPGEPVRNGAQSAEDLQVTSAFDGSGDVVHVLDGDSEPMEIPLRNLVVLSSVIEKRFNKRLLDPDILDARFPLPTTGATALAQPSSADPRSLHGKVFLITRGEARVSIDGLKRRIVQNGGQVEDNWQSLFKIRDDRYEISTPLVPFVIQMGATVMSSKAMAAMAAGIPILAARYIDDVIAHGADWRSYLVSAGESKYLFPGEAKGYFVSQMVDPMWGEASWKAKTARPIRQPFKNKSVFFLIPQSSPKNEEIKVLLPFCLLALGATIRRGPSLPTNFASFDLIMVEDRDKGVSFTRAQKASGKLVNVAWLKSCLPLGKALPPALVSTAE